MEKNKRKGKDVQEELQKDLDREVHTNFVIAPFMEEEKKKAKNTHGKDPQQYIMGLDALAVYVHKDNPLNEITIEQLGGSVQDVVRTRMLLTDPADQDAVGAVHARFFGDVRPAATMAGVAWLCRPEWKVEIEVEAIIQS